MALYVNIFTPTEYPSCFSFSPRVHAAAHVYRHMRANSQKPFRTHTPTHGLWSQRCITLNLLLAEVAGLLANSENAITLYTYKHAHIWELWHVCWTHMNTLCSHSVFMIFSSCLHDCQVPSAFTNSAHRFCISITFVSDLCHIWFNIIFSDCSINLDITMLVINCVCLLAPNPANPGQMVLLASELKPWAARSRVSPVWTAVAAHGKALQRTSKGNW